MADRSVVAIAASTDEELGDLRAPLDAFLSRKQVDAVVRRALDLDGSPRALKRVVRSSDWVVIKPNIVTSPTRYDCSYWHAGVPHPGQVTDLRVIWSLVRYLIEQCPSRRITIAEGGAEWRKAASPDEEDGWTVCWPHFGGLSYAGIAEEFDGRAGVRVDLVDLNYDEIRFLPVPDPMNSGIGAMQRVGQQMRPPKQYGRGAYVPDTGELRKGYYVPATILECDKVISVPAMKTHSCGTTLALKNYIGILPTHPSGVVRKGEIHQGDYQKGFIDLFSYHPAEYSLIEGFWGTEGNGPQWGENVRHNVVVASADPVAADAVASEVMGFNAWDLDYLYLAQQKGFGTFDPERIEIAGRPVEQVRRIFAPASGRKGVPFASRGNRVWRVCKEGEEWQILESEERYIDLDRFFGASAARAQAKVEVSSARDQSGWLWATADGRMQVLLDGRTALEKSHPENRGFAELKVPVELGQGRHLLEVYLERGEEGMGFILLLCDENGYGLRDVEYRIPVEAGQERRCDAPAGQSL